METNEMPIIKNIDELVLTDLRRDALTILEAGYQAIVTERVINEHVSIDGNIMRVKNKAADINLSDYKRVFFIGIGKCAFDAGAVFEKMLGDKITDGIIIDVKGGVLKKLRSHVGTHPLPSEENVAVTRSIVDLLKGTTEEDLIMVVISGGGSSLLCLPHELNCETLSRFTEELMRRGATIAELNTVRKHLSEIQGGQFAKLVYPSPMIAFIFSDVPGNDIGMIASGPTVMDETTKEDAENILAKYDVLKACAAPDCEILETPKERKYFENVENMLILTNLNALVAMQAKARELGYMATIASDSLEGEAREIGVKLVAKMKGKRKTCMLYGGETIVTFEKKIKEKSNEKPDEKDEDSIGGNVGEKIEEKSEEKNKNAQGGRNQEASLGVLATIPPDLVFVAAASDGWDNTDVAGAICDSVLFEEAKRLSVDVNEYLDAHNSYDFFKKVGGHIKTGRMGSNVSDLYFVLSN
ncbi:MAG: hypothetical protein COZ49_00875 [Candidatus Yonathbacteria bacterium CG_4_10_14_3_um_filter_47_65]|uniref:Glycerate kinase n=2 Tax=Parcubacteria group TaxID=1794811 RepID=A0A2M8D9R1_9BACT|nr:MAG: hypothetical protein AUJ44_01025 [Candidatus Nomurabacteria bacterium CG1_02_47_685]PIP04104.1 MAG: hypothetical protein COX54_00825 [Candidatus Yonathbacteria bacterium CG23_combo_of_CG06-09_8_20_14_all_46_18]PIQ32666.1 MAG: hypothetical protein COW61_01065 [Candidatus Yonathbacteria bacterium CG17_big_fil_post_rev_8_21_14_2_50_46_19]PIX56659.1 MAG: hypothetical protein COZ49_00875 [Candidatus Yonathbacteria bacterium CG_4_10_14_3_um_filter_47_65]PIY57832.1 MAG: hypothetical protein CO